MRLRVVEPVAGLPDLARLEFSPNLSGWLPYPVT
jgi:hypothetical protein